MLAENNTFSAGNQKLKAQVDRLEKEIALSNQKVAGLKIDKETRSSRLSDLEAMLRSKDELNKTLENKETTFQEDINDLRNEIVRLTGVESLLNDRNEIIKNEDIVDNLFDSIKLYIARILQEELSPKESQQALNILNFTTNMEHIGDIVNNSLMDISKKKISKHIQFSKEGFSEIISIHEVVCSDYDLAISTFMSNDCELAKVLYGKKQELHKLETKSVSKHLQRIGKGVTDSLETSSMHIDVIRDYKRINSLLSSIAYPILFASGEILETRLKQNS